jgi:hypothetical protein
MEFDVGMHLAAAALNPVYAFLDARYLALHGELEKRDGSGALSAFCSIINNPKNYGEMANNILRRADRNKYPNLRVLYEIAPSLFRDDVSNDMRRAPSVFGPRWRVVLQGIISCVPFQDYEEFWDDETREQQRMWNFSIRAREMLRKGQVPGSSIINMAKRTVLVPDWQDCNPNERTSHPPDWIIEHSINSLSSEDYPSNEEKEFNAKEILRCATDKRLEEVWKEEGLT